MKIDPKLLWIPIPLVLAACSGLTHRRNDLSLSKIKRVAIAGFESIQAAPALSIPKNKGRVEEMYTEFAAAFARQTHWEVLPVSKMKANENYRAAYDRTMKGFQNKSLPRQKERKFLVDGVLDNDSLRVLDTDGRTQLMKALGVDALVTGQVNVLLNGGAVFGIGSLHPQARLGFEVYVAGAKVSDWFESDLLGEEAKESVGFTGFFDADKLADLGLASMKSAVRKISRK